MKRRALLAVLLAGAGALALADDRPAVRPTAPPRRIASLNLAADEILVELVPVDRLVTVTAFVDDPHLSNVVGRVPATVTRVTHAQLERLIQLRPDLVIVSDYTDADFLHLLDTSGLRYHRLGGLESIAGIRAGITGLAAAVGEAEKGRALVEGLDRSLAKLTRRLAAAKRPRVLFWNDPDAYGADTITDAMLTQAGGTNVAREMKVVGVRPVGAERVLGADPDVIVVAEEGGAKQALVDHAVLSRLRAVKQGRIVVIPGALLTTLTHHVAQTCWFLAHALHPAQVPEVEPRE